MPAAELIEAESIALATIVQEAAGLSGASAVTASVAWQPLVRVPAPPLGDDALNLWVRRRGGPICLKQVDVQGKQQDVRWDWSVRAEMEWQPIKKLERSKLSGEAIDYLVLIRGPVDARPAPVIDALCWLPLGSAMPEDPPQPPTTITVAWDQPVTQAGPWAYGLNAYKAFDPKVTGNPTYQQAMTAMAPGLIRIHSMEMIKDSTAACGWLKHKEQTWDADKMVTALTPLKGRGDLLFNVIVWPPWMDADQDKLLDAGRIADFAAFCAEAVRILNVEHGFGIRYWEITNEHDDPYHNHLVTKGDDSRIAELCEIFNAAAVAMKRVDPSIITGGPAAIRPDLTDAIRLFVRGTREQLGFLSYHAYASGNAADADRHVYYRRVEVISEAVTAMRALVREEIPERELPNLLDEYNVSWTWTTRDQRMIDHRSAVFDALVTSTAVTAGATGTTAWNECDGIYGKLGPDLRRRPSSFLFEQLNARARGTVVRSSSSQADVVVYAVRRADGGRLVMLVNRGNGAGSVPSLAVSGEQLQNGWRVDERGVGNLTDLSLPLILPRMSVTLIDLAKN